MGGVPSFAGSAVEEFCVLAVVVVPVVGVVSSWLGSRATGVFSLLGAVLFGFFAFRCVIRGRVR